MPKINEVNNKINWIYKIGFFIILALPLLILPPYFFPADWGKTIVFRSMLAIMLFLFVWQILYPPRLGEAGKKNDTPSPSFKRNYMAWALGSLLTVFTLATIFSVDVNFSLWGSPYRGGGFVDFAFYFVFALLAFILFKKEDWKNAWNFSIFIGVLVSLLGIIQYYGLFNQIFITMSGQPPSTMGNPILLAIYLLLIFFPTLSFTIKEKNKNIKIFYIASLVIFLFTILITGTRAAYFGIIIGVLYFLFFYPKKIKYLKIAIGLSLTFLFLFVIYANSGLQLPKLLQNRIIQQTVSQLSVKRALNDERYRAWQTVSKEILDRPILGWGPENLAVGFDKFYDPTVTQTPWWDKAHNVFFQIGAEAGILGILTYIILFIFLFWQLQNTKKKSSDENQKIIITGIQAALIGYLVAMFFSFDSYGTYIILFLLIGYSLHLIYGQNQKIAQYSATKKTWWKPCAIFIFFIVLAIFLWQYNFVPLQINAQINQANDLANQKQCDQAFNLMDNALQQHSFLDSYGIMEYVDIAKTCSGYYPENTLKYTQKSVDLLSEAIKIQPLYTRYWLYLGTLTTTLANNENAVAKKNDLIKQADGYFSKALQLAPKHQEIFIGKSQLDIVAGDYKNAQNDSEECIKLNSNLGDCYWQLGISEIYLNNKADAQKNILLAKQKGYDTESESSLDDLVNAYGQISDYQDLAPVFQKLVAINPNNAQYRTYLNYVNSKLGK